MAIDWHRRALHAEEQDLRQQIAMQGHEPPPQTIFLPEEIAHIPKDRLDEQIAQQQAFQLSRQMRRNR